MSLSALQFRRPASGQANAPGRLRRHARRCRDRRQTGRFELLEPRHLLAIDVTNLDDSGANSLRWAIDQANAALAGDTIVFRDLSTGTISLQSQLPTLAKSNTAFAFAGTTQALTIDGSAAGAADGLVIGKSVDAIGLSGISVAIKNFTGSGVVFEGGSKGTSVKGLALSSNGTGIEFNAGTYTGTVVQSNTLVSNGVGLSLAPAGGDLTDLQIGGVKIGAGNSITSSAMNGVTVAAGDYSGTVLQGNAITKSGSYGISLDARDPDTGAAASLTNLLIGGFALGVGNTIADNAADGIYVTAGDYAGTAVQGNSIERNQTGIGINADDNGKVLGLLIGGARVGLLYSEGNKISANRDEGVSVSQGVFTGTAIQGNLISLNTLSGVALGDGEAAPAGLSDLRVIGNVVTQNGGSGIEVAAGDYKGTLLHGNIVTKNSYGISLNDPCSGLLGTPVTNLTIGGSGTNQGNAFEANLLDGLVVFRGDYSGTVVQGNTITLNGGSGVNLSPLGYGLPFTGLLLGGGLGAGNIISKNTVDGVMVNAGVYAFTAVKGNTISDNGRSGVEFLVAPYGLALTGFQLGGGTAWDGNTIRNNVVSGIEASKGDYTLTLVAGNTISGGKTGISLNDTTSLTVGGTTASLGNTITGTAEHGLRATGDLTGTRVLGNTFTTAGAGATGVSLTDVRGLAIGGASQGDGNTLTGGAVGLVATGNMAGTSVSGNVFTGQVMGIRLRDAVGSLDAQPFTIGGAADKVGSGAGNQINAVSLGLYATGNLTQTFIRGNRLTASSPRGNAMALENASRLAVGGTLASHGNTLSATQGNALSATGDLTGTVFYRNTVTGSQYGALLTRARNFMFGNRAAPALGNLVQSNRVGVRAFGVSTGSQVCWTTWSNNLIRLQQVSAPQLVVFPRV